MTFAGAISFTLGVLTLVYVALAVGAILGGILRDAITLAVPTPDSFPLGILLINLSGSLLLGLFYGLAEIRPIEHWLRVGFGAGVIGSFTTFSTFCIGSDSLAAGNFGLSVLYIVLSIIVGPVLAFAGDRTVVAFTRRLVQSSEEFSA